MKYIIISACIAALLASGCAAAWGTRILTITGAALYILGYSTRHHIKP